MIKFFKKNKIISLFLFNIFLLFFLLVLSFPLYKFFSYVTGYNKPIELLDNEFVKNSTILNLKAQPSVILDRTINIEFKAELENNLNWRFEVMENNIDIKIGESKIVKFLGTNLSNKTITSTADFYADPESILPYLIKVECFCFTEQTLKSGEDQIFSLVFYLDSSLDNDANLDELKELILTYKFSEFTS